jgi:hypothetical protein
MPLAPFWAGCLGMLLLGSSPYPPLAWSPDGRWLAYTQPSRPAADVLAPGWIFGTDDDPSPEPRRPGPAAGSAGIPYRLWATQAETGVSVLLQESRGPLSAPGWNPDGSALAFGRLVPEGEGRARYEVVIQDAPERRRVLRAWPAEEVGPRSAGLAATAVAWSPDGRYLAVPVLRPSGLAIVRADTGEAVRQVPGAFSPSWSPDGSKLAYYRDDGTEGLYCANARQFESRLVLDLSDARRSSAPVWSPDGQSLAVARRLPTAGGTTQVALVRVRVDSGAVEPVKDSLFADGRPLGRALTFSGASFGLDRMNEHLFSTTWAEDKPHQISWYLPARREPRKNFNPVEGGGLVPLGALAVMPAGTMLAMRVGPAGAPSPVALCEPERERLIPLVPDDAARAEWLGVLIGAARDLLRDPDQCPRAMLDGTAIDRATLLPAPGEVAPDTPLAIRLRHLARVGRPLCDRPSDAPPADEALRALLDEARLFFDYLSEDYASALSSLEAFEPRATGPDPRWRLMGLRAQIYLGLKDSERARGALAYLRAARPEPARRIEQTPAGPVLTPADPADAWPEFLAHWSEELKRGLPSDALTSNPLGHRNPDAPEAPLIELPAPDGPANPPLRLPPDVFEIKPAPPPAPRAIPGPFERP